ncbi:TPA: hypothetical protein QDC04_007855 [Burkholderia stabilis]|nr:hypothetical protein [Burkholderia stabilis]HDR9542937.1 hypothetical protein [Burkholderia stabilis]HDR9552030.1 hypothetical protein [Burkholderia stabilis]HDR9562992.1 hypothetical protein [Burkholderia stabilis]HDR9573184.1 hypothetical protein [Burkholderia stabilis]
MLARVGDVFPRGENERASQYARRLNLVSQQNQPGARVDGQPLSLPQLASLSGATEAKLRQDPQLVALPAELAPVRAAFPRQDNEKNAPYARRLNLASQQSLPGARIDGQPLSLPQLASLSGATEAHLRQDPQLFALPLELASVRAAFPRQDNEKAIQYARRLNLASQQNQPGARVDGQPLSLPELASLSGAKEIDLRQDPRLVALPAELAPVRAAFPRQDNEKAIQYARRLNLASQQSLPGARVDGQPLGLTQLASLSGAQASDLRQDPQLFALPVELVSVRAAFPRQDNEKNIPYARRLNLASQQSLPGARIDGQPLSLSQLASLSGAMEAHLRRDSQLVALPVELASVRAAFPRQEKEKAIQYARRLNLVSQQNQPGARIDGQPLGLAQLAGLSGATEAYLRRDPQLFALPAELAPVRAAFPRQDNEKNAPYARRLNLASQQNQPGARIDGQPLSLPQLASLSGATEGELRRDPQLVALPVELVSVRAAFPRQDNEKAIQYARRLNLASQQNHPGARIDGQPLSLTQLASLSGAQASDLRRDPQLFALPVELASVRAAFPRQDNEKNIPYARRLNLASQQNQPGARIDGQPLSLTQLASLSGAEETRLRRAPQLSRR